MTEARDDAVTWGHVTRARQRGEMAGRRAEQARCLQVEFAALADTLNALHALDPEEARWLYGVLEILHEGSWIFTPEEVAEYLHLLCQDTFAVMA